MAEVAIVDSLRTRSPQSAARWPGRLAALLLTLLLGWTPIAAGQQQATIEAWGDLKLCMTLGTFQTGPGRSFTLSPPRESVRGRPVFRGRGEQEFPADAGDPRVAVSVQTNTMVEFQGNLLSRFLVRFQGQPDLRADRIYDLLHDRLSRTYAVGPRGPVFTRQEESVHQRTLLLLDTRGNSLFLDFFVGNGWVLLDHYARGKVGAPRAGVAQSILGRFPGFCERPGSP